MVISLTTSALAPLWAFAFGPLVLGVPHLLADLRYLVVRSGLLVTPVRLGVAMIPVLAAWAPGDTRGWALAVVATAALAAPGLAWGRRALGVALGALLVALGLAYPVASALVLLHAHNLVAISFWLLWRRRAGRAHLLVVAAMALGAALLASGALDRAALALPLPLGVSPASAADWLAPGVPAPWDGRLVRVFVYFQALHYVVWLRLVPEEDRPRESARTYRREWRELVGDVGALVAWAVALGTVGLVAWGWGNAGAARDAYLNVAVFHGFLELGVAAWWLLSGTRPGAATAR